MISVILPNYNHASFLKKRIDSILIQTYQNFELIILDDFSTDNSREVIELYRNNSKVTHIVYNEENSGSTFKQWQKGIDLAEGQYIWIAESDDYADPTLLESLLHGFSKDKSVVLSYAQSYSVDKNDIIKGNWRQQTLDMDNSDIFSNDFNLNGTDFIVKYLIEKNVIPNASAVLFKKDTYLNCGGVDLTVKYCADWLLWLKMLSFGHVYFVHDSLNYFRFHEKSVIAQALSNSKSFDKKYDIVMRELFLVFLQDFCIREKNIRSSNKLCLSKDSYIEAVLCGREKRYFEMFRYFLKSVKYGNYQIKSIYKKLIRVFYK